MLSRRQDFIGGRLKTASLILLRMRSLSGFFAQAGKEESQRFRASLARLLSTMTSSGPRRAAYSAGGIRNSESVIIFPF
jgi:hypothetical protein